MKPTLPRAAPGLPSRSQVLDFIAASPIPAGKREIARHFRLSGGERIALKALLKDMAEEGLIEGKRTAYTRLGGVPRVTVLRVVAIEDGAAIAVPDAWAPDAPTPPPRLRVIKARPGAGARGRGHFRPAHAALTPGDRVLARTEETEAGWCAHVMKKLPPRGVPLLGVVEVDRQGTAWLASIDKRNPRSTPLIGAGDAVAGQLVRAEPDDNNPRAPARVIEVLGDPFAPRNLSLIAIHRHGIPHAFAAEALAEAEVAAKLAVEDTGREDLSHLPFLAIDPADARDHDDAIWAEADDAPDNPGGFRACVAIADVSFYVRPGGAIDREARRRGNSVYFPDRVVPMLPHVLSGEVCSLRAGEPRAALVCHLSLDAKGRMIAFRFARARVRIAEVLVYEDAQRQIDEGTATPPLRGLWAAWAALAAARAARDPLELELPERRVLLDAEGSIAGIVVRERLDAHRVVEDFMIIANVAAAKALERQKAPVVYRVHEPPAREKLIALRDYLASLDRKLALGQVITPGLFNRMLKDIADPAEKLLLMEAVLRSQTQAYYGPRNAGHFGLALGSYAHFTSPIRRYADLLVHRALVDAYALELPAPPGMLPAATGLSPRDRADLSHIAEAISQTERRAMLAERETIDRYVAAWLAARVGESFDCRVTSVQRFGLFVTILSADGASLGGDGLVPVGTLGDEYFHHDASAQTLTGEVSGTCLTLGDRLRLRLAEANPLTGGLVFSADKGQDRGPAPHGRGGGRADSRTDRKPSAKTGRAASSAGRSRRPTARRG